MPPMSARWVTSGARTKSAVFSARPTAASRGTRSYTSTPTPAAATWTSTSATHAFFTQACGRTVVGRGASTVAAKKRRSTAPKTAATAGRSSTLWTSRWRASAWPWRRVSHGTLFVITETPTKGSLFRSDDYGDTWEMVNDDRNINFRPFLLQRSSRRPQQPRGAVRALRWIVEVDRWGPHARPNR